MEALATRYALALLKVAAEADEVSSYKKWLVGFDDLFEKNPDFTTYLTSAFIELDAKEAVIDKLVDTDFPYGANFLKLLVAKKRFHMFHRIRKEFVRLANETLGIKEGTIYSPQEMSDETVASIAATLAKKIGYDVELHNEIDTKLIGGFRINIQGQSFDHSLRHKLERLGAHMLERSDDHAH